LTAAGWALPFLLEGIDSDNGSEFINEHLYRYCQQQQIQFTRGRSSYRIDGANGSLTAVPGSPFQAGTGAGSLLVHPSGRIVYVVNCGFPGCALNGMGGPRSVSALHDHCPRRAPNASSRLALPGGLNFGRLGGFGSVRSFVSRKAATAN
jgi:hypothetical protein